MTNLSVKGLERRYLRTESMALVTVAAGEFEIPRNLVKANSMTRVVSGDIHKLDQSGIDDLIKE